MYSVISIIFPVFSLILLGYLTGKFGLFKDTASTELNYFVLWLALPAQLFSYTSKNKAQILEQPLFLVAFLGGSLLIYLLMYLLHWRSSRSNLGANFWGLSSSYSNTGYMGIPLCMLALGEDALGPAILATLLVVSGLFSISIIGIELGQQKASSWSQSIVPIVRALLKNPLLIAPIAGFAWSYSEFDLYAPLRQGLELLGAAASPCALISIGLFLVKKSNVRIEGMVTLVSLKLIVQPFVTWVIAGPILGLPTFWVNSAILLSALPTGTGPLMLAQYYRGDTEMISRAIFLTTLGSVFTLSFILWLIPNYLN